MTGSLATGQQCPLSQILIDDFLDAAHVMVGSAHVVKTGLPLPLGYPPGHLHTLDERAVYLDQHLGADFGQLVAEQD